MKNKVFRQFSGLAERIRVLLRRGPIDMTKTKLSHRTINILTTMRQCGVVDYRNCVFSLRNAES